MSTAVLAAPVRHRAPLRHRFHSAVARLIVRRIEPHLRATDPAELEELQHAAQAFAALSRSSCLAAGEIVARCAQHLPAAARGSVRVSR